MAAKDWERLAELVRERRVELGLTQEDARASGGPSTATMRLIEGSLQQSYQPATLRDLENVLQWGHGSVRAILAGGDPIAPHPADARPAARRPEIDFSGGDPIALRPWRQQVLREVYATVGLADRFGPDNLPDPDEFAGLEETLAMLPESRRPFRSPEHERDTWDDDERLLLNERVNLIAMMRRLADQADQREGRRRTGLAIG